MDTLRRIASEPFYANPMTQGTAEITCQTQTSSYWLAFPYFHEATTVHGSIMCGLSGLSHPSILVDAFGVEDLTGLDLGDIAHDSTAKIHSLFGRENFVPGWIDRE